MKKEGFAKRLETTLDHAQELVGLWTNTTIANVLDVRIKEVLDGINDGDAEKVTYELFPQLTETVNYAEKELQRVEG